MKIDRFHIPTSDCVSVFFSAANGILNKLMKLAELHCFGLGFKRLSQTFAKKEKEKGNGTEGKIVSMEFFVPFGSQIQPKQETTDQQQHHSQQQKMREQQPQQQQQQQQPRYRAKNEDHPKMTRTEEIHASQNQISNHNNSGNNNHNAAPKSSQ